MSVTKSGAKTAAAETAAGTRLTPEAIDALWNEYKKEGSSAAKDRLLLYYTWLVRLAVRRLLPEYNNCAEYEDYISSGVIGLISAMERFDMSVGVKFETYAMTRIRGEILDYMRAQDWAPTTLRKRINEINRTYAELEAKNNGLPTDQMVADELGLTLQQVQKAQSQTHMFTIMNFEEAVVSSRNSEDADAATEETPESVYLEKERKAILAEMVDKLPERERLVITLYYYEGLLLREIADILGVTESRVSQLHTEIIEKMRQRLEK